MYGTRWHTRRGIVWWNVCEFVHAETTTTAAPADATMGTQQGNVTSAAERSLLTNVAEGGEAQATGIVPTVTENLLVVTEDSSHDHEVTVSNFRAYVDMWVSNEQSKMTNAALDEAEACLRQRVRQDTIHEALTVIRKHFTGPDDADGVNSVVADLTAATQSKFNATKYGAAMSAYRSLKRVATHQDSDMQDDYEMQVTDDMTLMHVHSTQERRDHMLTLCGLVYNILLNSDFRSTYKQAVDAQQLKLSAELLGEKRDTTGYTRKNCFRNSSKLSAITARHVPLNALHKIVDNDTFLNKQTTPKTNRLMVPIDSFNFLDLVPASDNNPDHDAVIDFDDDAQWCAGSAPCDNLDAFMAAQCLLRHIAA